MNEGRHTLGSMTCEIFTCRLRIAVQRITGSVPRACSIGRQERHRNKNPVGNSSKAAVDDRGLRVLARSKRTSDGNASWKERPAGTRSQSHEFCSVVGVPVDARAWRTETLPEREERDHTHKF